jgi:hypothetical protein
MFKGILAGTAVLWLSLALGVSTVYATCGVEGTAVNSDGSKIDRTGTISSSWTNKKAYPVKGEYQLDLGESACGQRVTVYLDGNYGKEVLVKGWVRVNFTRR